MNVVSSSRAPNSNNKIRNHLPYVAIECTNMNLISSRSDLITSISSQISNLTSGVFLELMIKGKTMSKLEPELTLKEVKNKKPII